MTPRKPRAREGETRTKTPVIYGLFCRETGELRYIGKANDAEARLKSHLRDTKRRKTPLYSWLAKCVRDGKPPIMKILVATTELDWDQCERQVIAFHREAGFNLLNVAEGGNMPSQTIEQRRNSAKRMNGKSQARSEHQKRITFCKRMLSMRLAQARKKQEVGMVEHVLGLMRDLYASAPHICPEWANV